MSETIKSKSSVNAAMKDIRGMMKSGDGLTRAEMTQIRQKFRRMGDTQKDCLMDRLRNRGNKFQALAKVLGRVQNARNDVKTHYTLKQAMGTFRRQGGSTEKITSATVSRDVQRFLKGRSGARLSLHEAAVIRRDLRSLERDAKIPKGTTKEFVKTLTGALGTKLFAAKKLAREVRQDLMKLQASLGRETTNDDLAALRREISLGKSKVPDGEAGKLWTNLSESLKKLPHMEKKESEAVANWVKDAVGAKELLLAIPTEITDDDSAESFEVLGLVIGDYSLDGSGDSWLADFVAIDGDMSADVAE